MKNNFILFSLFFILFSFFFSCQDPINPLNPQPQLPSIPAGKGSFTLVISDINGRTIFPNTKKSDFAEYALEFLPKEGGTPIKETRTNTTLATTPIILNIGEYNLHVTAYMTAGGVKPAAYGEKNIEIKEGQNNSGDVSLKVIVDAGEGKFRWDITLSGITLDSLTEASMTITPLDDVNGTAEQTLNFTAAHYQGSCDLNSGYYNVLITLIKDDSTQQIKHRDILHIYQNLESVFTFTFSSSDFYTINYIVTFVYNNNGLDNGLQSYNQGSKISKPPDPTRNSYVFDGWYTDSACTIAYDFDNLVNGDITLYAKWQTTGTFVFGFDITDRAPVVDTGITIYDPTLGEPEATLIVTNASDYNNGIKWYYNGSFLKDGNTLTLDASYFSVRGIKFITVEASKDGVLYSTLVIFTVQVPAAQIGNTKYATLDAAIKAAAGKSVTITLLDNVFAPETGMAANTGYTISGGTNITLAVDSDCNFSVNAYTGNFALFTVESGASLTLDGSNGSLLLSGGGLAANTSRRGIYINGGEVTVKDNVTVAGFKCSGNYGGGVYMTGSSAKFTMSGGTIYGNNSDVAYPQRNEASTSGGAIYVVGGGTAKYDGRYGSANITSNNSTLPPNKTLSGTITISPNSGTINTYTKLYAVYNGNEMVSYQWAYSDYSSSAGTPITGATTPTYIPVDYGYYNVTVSAPGYPSKTSASVSVNTNTLAGPISINPYGEIQPGTILTAGYNGGEPDANNVTIKYQWNRESSSIYGANTSIYTPTDIGIYPVTVSTDGYYNERSNIAAYIKPDSVTTLTENIWTDGELTASSQPYWYSFNVTVGATYRIWWNKRNYNYGDGTKTADISVCVIYSNGKIISLDQDYGWDSSPLLFTADFGGQVYLQARCSTSGTYGIVYSTGTTRPINNTLNPPGITTTALSPNEWKTETLNADSRQHWYSLDVTGGITYYVWWNERRTLLGTTFTISGSTAANVDVTAWYSDGSEAFANSNTAWTTPKSFTATETGKITIQVRPYSGDSSYYGVYEIAYSDNNTRPSGAHTDLPNLTQLENGIWTNDSITAGNSNKWYSFSVTSGTIYRVWWNDRDSGDSSKMDVRVSGCYDDGTTIFSQIDSGWSSAQLFTASYTGTVYILVTPYSSDSTGTYGVVFSTSSTRPQ